jgi:hypothetical protein
MDGEFCIETLKAPACYSQPERAKLVASSMSPAVIVCSASRRPCEFLTRRREGAKRCGGICG